MRFLSAKQDLAHLVELVVERLLEGLVLSNFRQDNLVLRHQIMLYCKSMKDNLGLLEYHTIPRRSALSQALLVQIELYLAELGVGEGPRVMDNRQPEPRQSPQVGH